MKDPTFLGILYGGLKLHLDNLQLRENSSLDNIQSTNIYVNKYFMLQVHLLIICFYSAKYISLYKLWYMGLLSSHWVRQSQLIES